MKSMITMGLLVLAGLPVVLADSPIAGEPYCCEIVFSGYDRTETLTNFPALIRFSANDPVHFDYSKFASTNGWDLRLVDDLREVELPYAVDEWNTDGTSCVWVKIPALATGTRIWAFWGDPAKLQQAYTTNGAVWSQGYGGVWHLTEDETNYASPTVVYRDSSSNRYHGSYYYKSTPAPPRSKVGVIGRGQEFRCVNGYYTGDGVAMGNVLNPGTNNFTLSAWIYPNGGGQFLSKDYTWNNVGMWKLAQGGANATFSGESYTYATTGNYVQANQWTHIAAVRDGTNVYLYANGVLAGGPNDVTGMTLSSGQTIWIGRGDSTYGNSFHGSVDEVELSQVSRSANWIWACWSSQRTNQTFYTVGRVRMGSLGTVIRIN